MIGFNSLPPTIRTILVACFFIVMCVGACLAFSLMGSRRRVRMTCVILCTVLCGGVTALYAASLRAVRQSRSPSALSEGFCALPAFIALLILLSVISYYIYVAKKETEYRATTLTRSSIKEGVDMISSGLCFYYDGGRVILVNECMNRLCHSIVGRDLQNAELFREILISGEVSQDVCRLSDGDSPTLRLADGSVWMFSHETFAGIHQLSATDVTSVQAVTDELAERNKDLSALNLRLRRYGEQVDDLARSRERLEVKARIHRELGQALLASRRYLLEGEGAQNAPFELWQRTIALLRKEAEHRDEDQPMDMLMRMAVTMGINCRIEGELPNDEVIQRLFVQSAAEALTNAISHAGAKTLFVRLSVDAECYTARLSNDGERPTGKIVEGGGLSSLRRKIEREGGGMTVYHDPEFVLELRLPVKRGEAV